jgi:hypothetical protein
LLYTQVLNDKNSEERKKGLTLGKKFEKFAQKHIFYIDRGFSEGMKQAHTRAINNDKHIEMRRIYARSKRT